jgi:hypothetical protein
MTIFSRRQILVGVAAASAVAVLPAVANAASAEDWTCIAITWDGRHPSCQRALRWEDRLHWLLWKRVGAHWACLGPIVEPVHTVIDDDAPGIETYVHAAPAWEPVALDYFAEGETDISED